MQANTTLKINWAVKRDENIFVPKWMLDMFHNWDRIGLKADDTKEEHFNSLCDDAEDLLECIDNNFTGYCIDDVTAVELALAFMETPYYLDEVC